MAPATYMDVADAIRRDVEAGRWPIGDPIPGIDRLKDEYGVSRQTANRAVQHLVASGLLYSEGRRGTFIRPRLGPPAVVRDRIAYRDEIGYFFDRNAQDWRGVGVGSQAVGVAPDEIADALGVARGEHVMIRDRAVGPPGRAPGPGGAAGHPRPPRPRGQPLRPRRDRRRAGPGPPHGRRARCPHPGRRGRAV